MTISQMAHLPIGESYKQHELKIKSFFSKKSTYWETDDGNAFNLEFEDVSFDNFGKALISFRYFENKLITTEITIEIPEERYNQINSLQSHFENFVNSKLTKFKRDYSKGTISSALNQIGHCMSTDGEDYETTIYSRVWRKYALQLNDTIRISSGIYINPYINFNDPEPRPCRVVITYRIYGTKLYKELSNGRKGVYTKISEYGREKNKLKEHLEDFRFLPRQSTSQKVINLKDKNGIYSLPVKINNTLTLDFVLDLGAADVNLSQDVFSVLVKAGAIKISDYIGEQNYLLADGTAIKSNVINLKSLKIGEKEIKDVRASISNSANSPLLLGQSALKKLGKYSIDNNNSTLIIE